MIEIVAKKSTPKANTPAHSYIVKELRSGKVVCRPVPSFVGARAIAHRLVVQSGYKKAYRVEDIGRLSDFAQYDGASVYYMGLFGSIVVDYTTEDDEEPHIYVLGSDGNHKRTYYPEYWSFPN